MANTTELNLKNQILKLRDEMAALEDRVRWAQRKSIDLERELNQEKRKSIRDINPMLWEERARFENLAKSESEHNIQLMRQVMRLEEVVEQQKATIKELRTLAAGWELNEAVSERVSRIRVQMEAVARREILESQQERRKWKVQAETLRKELEEICHGKRPMVSLDTTLEWERNTVQKTGVEAVIESLSFEEWRAAQDSGEPAVAKSVSTVDEMGPLQSGEGGSSMMDVNQPIPKVAADPVVNETPAVEDARQGVGESDQLQPAAESSQGIDVDHQHEETVELEEEHSIMESGTAPKVDSTELNDPEILHSEMDTSAGESMDELEEGEIRDQVTEFTLTQADIGRRPAVGGEPVVIDLLDENDKTTVEIGEHEDHVATTGHKDHVAANEQEDHVAVIGLDDHVAATRDEEQGVATMEEDDDTATKSGGDNVVATTDDNTP